MFYDHIMRTRNGQNDHTFHLRHLRGSGVPPNPPKPPKTAPWCTPLLLFDRWRTKKGQNDYNLLTRPPIKILRPLFTLQLLILPTRDPFRAHKKLQLRATIEVFAFKLTPSKVKPQIEVKIAKILIFCP